MGNLSLDLMQYRAAFPVLLATCAPHISVSAQTSIAAFDTVITTESGLLASVGRMTVADGGALLVADPRGHALVIVHGRDSATTLGREGQGPGDFRSPVRAWSDERGFWVAEAGNSRLQLVSSTGRSLQTRRVEGWFGQPIFLLDDGRLLVAQRGTDTSLVHTYAADGELEARFGEPLAIPPQMMDFTALKRELREGRKPDAFRNQAIIEAGDSTVWLVLTNEPEIRVYRPDGTELSRFSPDFEQQAEIEERAVFTNRDDDRPNVVRPLSFFADALVTNDSIWLLLNSPDQAVVLGYSNSGRKITEIRIATDYPARRLAWDAEFNRLFLGTPDDAQVLVVEIDLSEL